MVMSHILLHPEAEAHTQYRVLFFAPQCGATFWSADTRAKEGIQNPTNNDTRKQTNKETNNTRKGRHCSAIPTHHAHCGKTQHLSSSNQLLPCLCEWCHLGEGAGRCQVGFWIRLSLIWIGFWMDACRHSDGMDGWMDGCVCVRIHRSL